MIPEHKVITYKGKVVFHQMKVTAPKRDLKPFQENEACFMFVKKGNFSIRTPDQIISFEEDQGMLAKCFNFFIETTKQQREEHETMEFLGVFLFPDHVENLLEINLADSNHQVNYNMKRVQIDALLNSFRKTIDVLLDNPELADEAMIETKLKEFILLMSKSQNTSPLDFLSSMFKLNSTAFKSTIQNNLYTTLNVDELAKLCAMSTSSFKRKFSEVYAESPKKYFDQKKLEKAVKLLSNTTERISAIAYDCGFDTISTFNRTFKSNFGVSPSNYRLNQTA
jgi:AraC-like DNA-binding protein